MLDCVEGNGGAGPGGASAESGGIDLVADAEVLPPNERGDGEEDGEPEGGASVDVVEPEDGGGGGEDGEGDDPEPSGEAWGRAILVEVGIHRGVVPRWDHRQERKRAYGVTERGAPGS